MLTPALFHTAIVMLLMTTAASTQAAPTPYRYISVYSEVSPINAFGVSAGSINNHGVMAVSLADPPTTYRVDWPVWTEVLDGSFAKMDINDNNQIGAVASFCCAGDSALWRLEADGTVVTLAEGPSGCPQPGDFCGFQSAYLGDGLNNSGQIATLAGFNDAGVVTAGVWLFDDDGAVEIARQDTVNPGGLFSITTPGVNDLGVVAFGASEVSDPDGGLASVYSGTGGVVTEDGTPPYPQGGQIQHVIINENGVIGVNGGAGIHTIDDGVVTTVVPAEFAVGSPTGFSFNDEGQVVYLREVGGVPGLYTGPDVVDDALLRSGDTVFDGVVTGGTSSFRLQENGLNNDGDIVFSVQINVDGATESHLVRAIALLPEFDSDDDGIANDMDNCLTAANPDQRDTNGDGIGNACDADLDDDCATNFGDLAAFKSVFLSDDEDADFNGDGMVNFGDLAVLKKWFVSPPGPSALPSGCD